MDIRLPRGKPPTVTVFGGLALGALLASVGMQMPVFWDRPACAETVMQAVSTEKPVEGAYACFDLNLQDGLSTAGIDSDRAFAARIGHSGTYRYLHKTEDGGYVYEYDREISRHNQVAGAWDAVRKGDVPRAWAELTGQTQRSSSKVYTLYVDAAGKVKAVI
jgi:hypothetical protein